MPDEARLIPTKFSCLKDVIFSTVSCGATVLPERETHPIINQKFYLCQRDLVRVFKRYQGFLIHN